MITGIYKIENTKNGKVYIGRAVNIPNRKSSHFSKLRKGEHGNIYLQHSYVKYGSEAFEFSILEVCSESELSELERYYIRTYRETLGIRNVYNMTDGGEGSTGYTHSPEVRRKMSK